MLTYDSALIDAAHPEEGVACSGNSKIAREPIEAGCGENRAVATRVHRQKSK